MDYEPCSDRSSDRLPTAVLCPVFDFNGKNGLGPKPAGFDDRMRRLVGEAGWRRLPSEVQLRFSKSLVCGRTAVYQGAVVETSLSRAGRVLAGLTRLIGSPLPLDDGAYGPAVVTVMQEARSGDQYWVRTYPRPGLRPQVVSSAKRFRGPTGLEEYIGYGIGMTLRVSEVDRALTFCSERYFFELGRVRFYLPPVLTPGRMTIIHRGEADGSFIFELSLVHWVFGRLLHQVARFHDGEGRVKVQ